MDATVSDSRSEGDTNAAQRPYRSVCVSAVLGLILGLASIGAFLATAMWMIPVMGIVVNLRALWSIAAAKSILTGRRMALTGLFLSVLFGAAAPSDAWGTRWFLEQSARPVAEAWFSALANDQPERALQLRTSAGLRRKLDDRLLNYYTTNKDAYRELRQFVSEPLVKTLLLIGPAAKVRLYETGSVEADETRTFVSQIYSVTFDKGGQTTTFFVNMLLERKLDFSQRAEWRVMGANGGVRPTIWLE